MNNPGSFAGWDVLLTADQDLERNAVSDSWFQLTLNRPARLGMLWLNTEPSGWIASQGWQAAGQCRCLRWLPPLSGHHLRQGLPRWPGQHSLGIRRWQCPHATVDPDGGARRGPIRAA